MANITVQYVNSAADSKLVVVPEGTTAEQFFKQVLPGKSPDDYTITVDGGSPAPRYELQDMQKFSVSPSKIQGA